MKPKLILASSSEGRKKLLSLFKIPFEIIQSEIDEEKIFGKTPLLTLKLRAKLKGENVFESVITHNSQPTTHNLFILSCDSGVIFKNTLIGKPKNYKEAEKILDILSGQTHEFVTAVYIIKTQNGKKVKIWDFSAKSLVTFRKLTKDDIKLYLKLTKYTKFAGGYALFASPQDFVTKIEGSLSNVIGFPLEKLKPILLTLSGKR